MGGFRQPAVCICITDVVIAPKIMEFLKFVSRMFSMWMCEIEARMKSSGWCWHGLAPLALPGGFSSSPPFCTREASLCFAPLYTQVSTEDALHIFTLTQHSESFISVCSSKPSSLRKNTARRIKKMIFHYIQTLLHVVNKSQTEAACLNRLFLKMCMMLYARQQLLQEHPSKEHWFVEGSPITSPPASWGLTRRITLNHRSTDPMIFTSSRLMYCSAIYQSLFNIDPFLNEPSLLCTMSNN